MQNRKRDTCTEQSFGLWEKARVGCFERTACILSIVKQITTPGGMHETSAWVWCTGKTRGIGWRGRGEGGSGWRIHVTPWLIHVNVWENPLQCCEVIRLQLIKINEKKNNKVCWLEFFLFISDLAFLLAKPLGLMNSISSSFPEVPLAKPCASYTGVMWWLYIARSKES